MRTVKKERHADFTGNRSGLLWKKITLGAFLAALLAALLLLSACGEQEPGAGTAASSQNAEASSEETPSVDPGPVKSVKDMVLYWNVDRDEYAFKSEAGLSSRPIDKEDGMYHFLFATTEDRQVNRRTASAPLKNRMDEARLMTLTFDEKGVIVDFESAETATGGYYANGFYVESYENGILRTRSASDLKGEIAEIEITPDLVVYDCSGKGIVVGERAKEEAFVHFARVLGVKDFDGSLAYLYIIDRPVEYKLYWNVTRRYDSAIMASTRQPNEDGLYEFELSVEGESGLYYCKDREVVNEMDKAWPKVFGLEFDADGLITKYIPGPNAANATKVSSWHTVMELGKDETGKTVITTESKVASAGDFGQVKTWTLDPNCKFFDTTGATGEVGCKTEVKVGDLVFLYREKTGLINFIYVVGNREYEPEIAEHHSCRECGKDVTWYKWDNPRLLPTKDGHYFLATDVTVDQQNVASNQHVVLCLNGHTVTGTGNRVYSLHYEGASLDVMDCQNTGKIDAGKEGDYGTTQGSCVWVRYGRFRLYSGTLDASKVTTNGSGAAVAVDNDTTFEMYGGKIIGGKAAYGGALRISGKGNFIMASGTIQGGTSEKRKEAGAIDVNGGKGRITMTGGSITDGIYIKAREEVTLGNALYVSGEKGLFLAGGQKVKLPSAMSGRVTVTLEDGAGFVTENYVSGAEKNFVSADPKYSVYLMSGKVALNEAKPHAHCVCGGKVTVEGHVHANETWFPWTATDKLPTTEGNYYLTKNVKLTAAQQLKKDQNVVLCLNGHTVTGDSVRLYTTFSEGSNLTISDCTGKGVIRPTGTYAVQGQAIWVRYGIFTLYSGTIDGSQTSGSKYGPIHSEQAGTIILNGGTVKGGSATTNGGSIYSVGKVVMNGGTVTGGKALSGQGGNLCITGNAASFEMNGGTIANGEAKIGGNLTIGSNAVVTINGGEIKNGAATRVDGSGGHGGNLYLSSGVLTVNGGTVKDGTVTNLGGTNLSANHHAGVINLNGGTVEGGIYLWNEEGIQLNVTGGTITSDRQNAIAVAKGEVAVSGDPVVSNLYLASGKTVSIGAMKEGAEVKVTLADGEGVLANNVSTDVSAYFKSTVEGTPVTYDAASKTLYLGDAPHTHCICGGTGIAYAGHACNAAQVWKKWTNTTTLPKESGYYYLANDVTLSLNTSPAVGASVYLCLNGHSVTQGAEGARIVQLNANGDKDPKKYVITNCGSRESAKITGKWVGEYATQGGIFWIHDNAANAIELYNVTVDGTANVAKETGSVISLTTGSLKAFNVTVLGGQSLTATNGGGSVYLRNSSIEFYACALTGGKALSAQGGVLFAGENSTVTIVDSAISGGEAKIGGNLATMAGTVNVINSTISGGTATRVDGSGGHGGNVYISSSRFEMTGGSITGGRITNLGGENISLNHVKGVGILHNVTVDGGIYVWNQDGSMTVDGGSVLQGSSSVPAVKIMTGSLTVTGAPKIDRVFFGTGKTVTVGALTAGADIRVELQDRTGTLATGVTANVSGYFRDALGETVSYAAEEQRLVVGHYHCVCGNVVSHAHAAVSWTRWDSTNSLPNTAGYYYLANDVTVTTNMGPAAGATVYLCLNGHTISQATAGKRIIQLNGNASSGAKKYVITNCGSRESGRIVGNWSGSTASQGGTLWSTDNDGNGFELYNLTLDGTANTASGAGGVINMTKGNLTAYSITILGGTTTTGATGGGCLSVSGGTSAIYNSVISGGTATRGYGGNVYVNGGSLLLQNTTVEGGTAALGGNDIYETTSGLVTIVTN